jgi:hypothetical protein
MTFNLQIPITFHQHTTQLYSAITQLLSGKEPAKQFNFLDLPAKLRNCIYTLHFTNSNVYINDKNARYHPPGLLLGCKSVYNEAILIYYRVATFYVFRSRGLAWFLTISDCFQEAVTHVRIIRMRYGYEGIKYEIQRLRHEFDEAGIKLKEGVIHEAVYTEDKDKMVWANGYTEAAQGTLNDFLVAYNRARDAVGGGDVSTIQR